MKEVEPIPPTQIICPFCPSLIDAAAFFCPNCGKNVREKPFSTGIWAQIGLYFASVLLPPLFIGWTIKYLKSADQKAKQIGMISLGLTIVTLVAAIWLSIAFVKNITQGVDQQLHLYQNLGL